MDYSKKPEVLLYIKYRHHIGQLSLSQHNFHVDFHEIMQKSKVEFSIEVPRHVATDRSTKSVHEIESSGYMSSKSKKTFFGRIKNSSKGTRRLQALRSVASVFPTLLFDFVVPSYVIRIFFNIHQLLSSTKSFLFFSFRLSARK